MDFENINNVPNIIAYAWKLNNVLSHSEMQIWLKNEEYLKNDHLLECAADLHRLREKLDTKNDILRANNLLEDALKLLKERDGYNAYGKAIAAIWLLDSYDGEIALSLSCEAAYITGQAAFIQNCPIESIVWLKNAMRMGEDREEIYELYEIAKERDIRFLNSIEVAGENGIKYLLRHPTKKRIEIADKILSEIELKNPDQESIKILRSMWNAANGNIDEAVVLACEKKQLEFERKTWLRFLGKSKELDSPIIFTDNEKVSAIRKINRGFMLWVNNLREEALLSLLSAQQELPNDPFIFYGIGLLAWSSDLYEFAEKQILHSIELFKKLGKQSRDLHFIRLDPTSANRSQSFTETMDFYNPQSCLKRIERRQRYSRCLILS